MMLDFAAWKRLHLPNPKEFPQYAPTRDDDLERTIYSGLCSPWNISAAEESWPVGSDEIEGTPDGWPHRHVRACIDDLAILTYCEGDITLEVYDDRRALVRGIQWTIEWYDQHDPHPHRMGESCRRSQANLLAKARG